MGRTLSGVLPFYSEEKGRIANNRKPVVVQGVEYPSKTAARKSLKIGQVTLEALLNEK